MGLTFGIPIGHPNSTVLISSPRIFLSADEKPNIHSLTGCLPLSLIKKINGNFLFQICHEIKVPILVHIVKSFVLINSFSEGS
jgi:hypothetical protein